MRVETASSEAFAKGKGGKKTGAAAKGRKKTPEEAEALSPPAKRRSLAVEEKYQKMTQREHIIRRPDTYSWDSQFLPPCSWISGKTDAGDVGV